MQYGEIKGESYAFLFYRSDRLHQMFPVESFENTIGKFVAIAEAIGLPFHITGGSISSAYGEPRLTQDIDIVVAPDVARIRIDDLIAQLGCSDFLFTERVLRQAVQSGSLFQLLDKTESLKLDIYPRELIPGELLEEVLSESDEIR